MAPRRSYWVAGSGCSRDSSTTSTIRQGLAAGVVDKLAISSRARVAPIPTHVLKWPSLSLDRLELIRFLQVAPTISVHHGALAYLPGINALRASETAAVRFGTTPRPSAATAYSAWSARATSPPPCHSPSRRCGCSRPAAANEPKARWCCGRPGKPIDRRDAYRMVARIAKVAGIPRHISPHSLRHAAITSPRRRGPAARRADPRPPRRPAHHRALRSRPRQPRPPRRPLPHRLRRRRLNGALKIVNRARIESFAPRKTVSASCPRRQRLPLGTSSTGDAMAVETHV